MLHLKKLATWHGKHPSWNVLHSQVLWGGGRLGEALPGIFLKCASHHWKYSLMWLLLCWAPPHAGGRGELELTAGSLHPPPFLHSSSCPWTVAKCYSFSCRLGWGRVQDDPCRMEQCLSDSELFPEQLFLSEQSRHSLVGLFCHWWISHRVTLWLGAKLSLCRAPQYCPSGASKAWPCWQSYIIAGNAEHRSLNRCLRISSMCSPLRNIWWGEYASANWREFKHHECLRVLPCLFCYWHVRREHWYVKCFLSWRRKNPFTATWIPLIYESLIHPDSYLKNHVKVCINLGQKKKRNVLGNKSATKCTCHHGCNERHY